MAIFKVPRLTSIQRATLTPEASEILFDTTNNNFYGGDGVTLGGVVLGTMDEVVHNFNELDDTPSSYTSQGSKLVSVKATEDGLEFIVNDYLKTGDHASLDTLVHNIAENSYTELIRTDGKITNIIVWETASKLKKIKEETIIYTNNKVSSLITKQYNSSGVLSQTYTETITRTEGKITSIAGALS